MIRKYNKKVNRQQTTDNIFLGRANKTYEN